LLVLTAFPITTAIAAEYGLRNPGMSPTERSGDVRIHLSDQEAAGVNFIINYEIDSYSDGYPAGIAKVKSFNDGWDGPIESVGPLTDLEAEKTLQNTPFLYREQLREVTNITYPDDCSTYYDSGGSQIIHCRHAQ
jgi:hypothetical protein